MPALDFPSNPIDGQVSGNYVWSASSGAWKSKPSVSTVTIHSASAPTIANAGDVWYNTNTGISFTYYDDGTSRQWVEMFSSAVPAINTIMPSGTIVQTARATAPDSWLFCDGTAVSRTLYSTLFAAIGTQYGSGDGSTTFNIPNLQGRVPVGKSSSGTFTALGATGGTETVTLDATQIPSHTHTFSGTTSTDGSHTHQIDTSGTQLRYLNTTASSGTALGGLAGIAGGADNYKATANGAHSHTYSGTTAANTGGNGSHNNLQPYIILNYMIKV